MICDRKVTEKMMRERRPKNYLWSVRHIDCLMASCPMMCDFYFLPGDVGYPIEDHPPGDHIVEDHPLCKIFDA